MKSVLAPAARPLLSPSRSLRLPPSSSTQSRQPSATYTTLSIVIESSAVHLGPASMPGPRARGETHQPGDGPHPPEVQRSVVASPSSTATPPLTPRTSPRDFRGQPGWLPEEEVPFQGRVHVHPRLQGRRGPHGGRQPHQLAKVQREADRTCLLLDL